MLDEIKTVTPSGVPVKERVTSIRAARELYRRMKDAEQGPAKRRARIKGLIDGDPPYDPNQLKELGLGYMTNVNFLEARSILDQKAGAAYELFFEIPTLIEAKQAHPTDKQQPQPNWGAVVSEEFTKMLRDWTGFMVNMDKARREADAYAVGLMVWRDEWDWRPKAFNRGSFIPEPQAELDIETLNTFCLRDRVTAGQLYRWAVEDEKLAKEEGWDPAAVKKLLVRVYDEKLTAGGESDTDRYQMSDWETIQQRIRNNDWYVECQELELVKVVHLCIREMDTDEVSHYIFAEEEFPEGDGFLFKKARRFREMQNVLWLLPYNYGDGYLRSVRGMAESIEHHCDLSNRFLGRIFDAGFTVASLLLQPESPMDMSKLQLIRMGIITVIPPGLKTLQSTFGPPIDPLVQLRDLSVNIMKNNTGVWRQHPELFADAGPSKTAYQVSQEVSKEARLEKINVAYDYEQAQRLYREIFRRATNPAYLFSQAKYPGQEQARKFVARCLERGVPPELLLGPDMWEVYATQAIGLGSWGVKLDITNQVLNTRNLFDEQGQINAVRDWLAVRVGYQNVDRYKAIGNRDLIPSNEWSIATLENNDMAEGQPVAVGADQIHAIHIYAHMQPVQQVIQAVMETQGRGLDLKQAINILSGGLPHIQAHLEPLAADPARQELVKGIETLLTSGVSVLKTLLKVQEAQDQEVQRVAAEQEATVADAQATIQDRELEAKVLEIQKKYELERMKQDSLNQMRADKTAGQMDIRRQQASEDMRLKQERQDAELRMAQEKTQAEIARKAAAAPAGA